MIAHPGQKGWLRPCLKQHLSKSLLCSEPSLTQYCCVNNNNANPLPLAPGVFSILGPISEGTFDIVSPDRKTWEGRDPRPKGTSALWWCADTKGLSPSSSPALLVNVPTQHFCLRGRCISGLYWNSLLHRPLNSRCTKYYFTSRSDDWWWLTGRRVLCEVLIFLAKFQNWPTQFLIM